MKFTLSWLGDHLDTEAGLSEITEALTDLGLEVEGVEDPAEKLGAFRIARVVDAVQHPNADRLRLCRVETFPDGPDGRSEMVRVVCGAPNARTGLVGVFAPPGTHVPGTDVVLKPGVIRGEESNGMLCSERELMLSDDHEGIIELPEDAPLGARYIDYADMNDPVVEIAVTPNRPDALGVRGIARDLAARGLGVLKPVETTAAAGGFPCPVSVTISDDLNGGCPMFAGRLVRGVRNGPSPDWLRRRLDAIGLRPISALVDITNFLTYDRNRPLHVFDADKLSGDLVVRPAKAGEKMMALDEKAYTLKPGMMIIADNNGVESIGGIMGGLETGCTAETVNVFVESAYWDNVRIARAGREFRIDSDARHRNERGIDPAFSIEGLDLACGMITGFCGGEVSEIVVAGAEPDVSRSYRFDAARVGELVGMSIPEAAQRTMLEALGFKFEGDKAKVPSWRPDILGEADLVEEVARIASLTKLKPRPLPRLNPGVPAPILTPLQKRETAARRCCAALGYNECVTYSFIDEKAAEIFGADIDAARLRNPISSEMSHMRPALLPGLLRAVARNQSRGFFDLGLFEAGWAFHGVEPGDQRLLVTGVLVGCSAPRLPHGERRYVDVFDAKRDCEAVLSTLGAPPRCQVTRGAADWWHPERSGRFCLGPKNILAEFGEIHPKILTRMDVKGSAVGFTIWPEEVPLPKKPGAARPALELSDLHIVDLDLAFVVDRDIEASALVNAAIGVDKAVIEDVRVFEEFAGEAAESRIGKGKKSIAFTVRIRQRGKTMTAEEIGAILRKIAEKVAKATGGVLRDKDWWRSMQSGGECGD